MYITIRNSRHKDLPRAPAPRTGAHTPRRRSLRADFRPRGSTTVPILNSYSVSRHEITSMYGIP